MLDKLKQSGQTVFEVLKAAGKEYGNDRVARMSAAVAYRAIFALAPLFLLAVWVFGLFLGADGNAEAEIMASIGEFTGPDVQEAVGNFLDAINREGPSAGLIAIPLLLWTGSSLFMELQKDLNDIFHVPDEQTKGVVAFLRKRGIGFLFSLGIGLILIAIVLLNSAWQLIGGLFPESFAPVHALISFLAPLVSLIVLPLVLALTFQFLVKDKVRWRAVWWGSFFTSVVILAASYGASLYFQFTGESATGAAGAIFVILLLAFILSAVYLFGAEVTKVYDDYLRKGDIKPPEERKAEEGARPSVVTAEPRQPLPLAALFAFLGGLFVGWRRSR